MSYLSEAGKAGIIANPESMADLYNANWQGFAHDLGLANQNMTLNNTLLACAFASIYAWSLKPYGQEPNETDLTSILASPTLACDDYVRLTLYFMEIIPQSAGAKIEAVGWDHGAVGNHAQLFVTGSETLLLDPTIGLVARGATYNMVAAGKATDPFKMQSFFSNYGGTPSIASFNTKVISALTHGLYKPSDALYYCASLDYFNHIPDGPWPTPAAAAYQLGSA